MKKITFSILFSLCCVFGFAQTFPGTGTPTSTQGPGGGTAATCGTPNELNLTVDVTGVGVLGTANILDQVDIDITHTWAGDINVTLIAPDGTTSANLTSGNGGSADDYTGTQFRDDAATPITDGTAPFTGVFQPEEPLSTFNGVDADGTWTLNFCDSANGDVGTFNSWSITFAPAPACLAPSSLTATPTSLTEATVSWTPGGSETQWTYEYGVSPYAQGGTPAGSGTVGSPTVNLSGLVAGTTYDFYVQANCGGGNGDSDYVTVQWTHPSEGDSCSLPILATVESDCSTATPITIDYSTAADLGTSDFSCDTVGVNTGAWFEFTTTATGAITLNMSDSNEYAIFDACGGSELVCVNTPATSAEIVLSPSTTYKLAVWKDGATTGTTDVCIEEFTPPTPPDCAETPITPADGAVDVVVTAGAVTLTWTAPSSGPAPTDYRIFFGETSGALADLGTIAATATTVDITGIAFSTTYYWQIVPQNGASQATGCAEWSFTTEAAPPPPSNDDCANAIVVTPGGIFADNPITGQTNVSATDSGELPLPGCASYDPADPTGNGGDLWYAVTVPSDGNLTIETDADPTGSGGDGGMAVYTGSCGSLALFECNDDGGNGLYGQVIIEPADGLADQTVYIRVWEFGGDGIINFQVSAFSATLSTGSLENEAAFSYYPNPVENTLTLNAASSNIDNVVMFNMLGQQVMQVTPNDLTSELDMSNLQTGTYFVRVTVANVTKTIRVVKQ